MVLELFGTKLGRFDLHYEGVALEGIASVINGVSGASYQFCIGTLDGSGNIATITKVPANLTKTSGHQFIWNTIEASLSDATTYFVLVGRTDSTATYAMPVQFNAGNAFLSPLTAGSYVYVASTDPVVGDATVSGAGWYCTMGLKFDF